MRSMLTKAGLAVVGGVALASVGCFGGLTPATPTPTPLPTATPTPVPSQTKVPPTILFRATGVSGTVSTGSLIPVAGKQLTVQVFADTFSTDQFQIFENGAIVIPYTTAPVNFVTTPTSNAVVEFTVTQMGFGSYNLVVSQPN